jgi:hypothetical protein
MIPEAKICHLTNNRIRFKIATRKEDHQYFSSVHEKLLKAGFAKSAANPLTGSVMIEKKGIKVEEIAAFGKKNKLFAMTVSEKKESGRESLLKKVIAPISGINTDLKKFSDGDVDLPAVIFIILLAFGVIEILRGNFKMPPWYTAFWYAFGVFSKAIFDSRQTNKN